MLKFRLKKVWFDQNAIRRRPGVIYDVPESYREHLPSGTEILNEKNDVVEVVDRTVEAEPKQVVEVEVTADKDAKVSVDEKQTKLKL